MTSAKSSFLFLGNDDCLDFINTESTERGRTKDLLSSFEDLLNWLSAMDYIDPGIRQRLVEKNEPERLARLERAREFRSHLRYVIETVSSGKPLVLGHLDPINKALVKEASFKKLVLINSKPRLITHSASQEYDPLSSIAFAASNLLTEKDISLIRKCEARSCNLYFYDESKNHARRWCSMARCGNRMKAALYYKKKKAKLPS